MKFRIFRRVAKTNNIYLWGFVSQNYLGYDESLSKLVNDYISSRDCRDGITAKIKELENDPDYEEVLRSGTITKIKQKYPEEFL